MVSHQWPVALVVIWHIYSCLACSSEDSARDLPSSGKVVLGQGQVSCEFQADRPTFIFHLAAPDVIWHIYSHLYCSSRDGGRDLPSSGEAAPIMGQVPCEFQADWPNFIFQLVAPDMIWHIYTLRKVQKILPYALKSENTYLLIVYGGCFHSLIWRWVPLKSMLYP